ncbi:MAG: nucleoside deaminase, partial [Thermoplasmata archaeon]|nr:nucleoside deaminase [Thermoplasmata archaeon]
MKKAIAKAREGIGNGQTPFGACIVKNNEVIACQHNQVWEET